jgi:hypothetical protein
LKNTINDIKYQMRDNIKFSRIIKMKIYGITYGSHRFANRCKVLTEQAKETGLFDSFEYLTEDDLNDRFNQLKRADWGMNTNIMAVFNLILNQATKHNLPESEMPTKVLILSDMQFDSATGSGWGRSSEWNPTAQELIERKFSEAGYKVPTIVYWNIQSRGGDVPVAFDKQGTALISGFSPAIMKSVLNGKNFTPYAIMDETILSERYINISA